MNAEPTTVRAARDGVAIDLSTEESDARLNDGPASQSAPTATIERLVRNIGIFVAPVSVVTAMLYYFGWVRTNAVANVYGINDSLLAFSGDDYVLRSVPSLFLPVGTAVLGALAAIQIDRALWPALHRFGITSRMVHRIGVGLSVTGWLAIAWGGWRLHLLPADAPRYLTPALLGFGVIAVGYGALIRRRSDPSTSGPALTRSLLSLLLGLAVVAAFTATFEYADAEGRGHAWQTITELPHAPTVTLLSRSRLQLPSDLVPADALEAPGPDDYAYRYRGLQLLTRNGGNLFLVPACFGRSNFTVLVVPDTGVRLEFTRGVTTC